MEQKRRMPPYILAERSDADEGRQRRRIRTSLPTRRLVVPPLFHVVVLLILSVVSSPAATASFFLVPSTAVTRSSQLQSTTRVSTSLSLARRQQQPSRNNTGKSGSNKPAFAQAAHQTNNLQTQQQQPRPKIRRGGDSHIGVRHAERISTAGRVGTKRYINPCKVFVGNLPFSVTEQDLRDWICGDAQMALPPAVLLNECKIVREWKTGKSKGYGFLVFTEAIYATVCIETCHGRMWDGRVVTVNQGVKKNADNTAELYLQKKRKRAADAEEAAIARGLDEADAEEEDERIHMDPEEIAMLRALDPDLVPSTLTGGNDNNNDSNNNQSALLDGENADDYGAAEEPRRNREKRRELERKQRRLKKTQSKGFGTS